MAVVSGIMAEAREIDLLIVDHDERFRDSLVRAFSRRGFRIKTAASGEESLQVAQRFVVDVAVIDIQAPGLDGLGFLERFRESHAECEFIVLSSSHSVETAVGAMKLGAYDFLTKPFPVSELKKLIEKAYERGQLRKENMQLRRLLERNEPKLEMVGRSLAMQEVFRLIERAGPSDKAILIQGESGTGKELVARALHHCSQRRDKPMVVINCAALPEPLLESELFGHEKGAFTGAISTKAGLFETADGGTLFIDEIGEMPGSVQAKLLRVLEDGSLRRVGSLKERRVNVRLLAATNRNLAEEVAEGRFREDLYYRINVMSLELPPLRERAGDIALLVAYLLGADWEIEPEAMQIIERYHWPGNVRQLINVMERAKILADGALLRVRDLPHEVTQARPAMTAPGASPLDDLSALERTKVREILRRERGNKTRAAHALGIDRRKLYRLIEKYGLQHAEVAEPAG